MATPQHTLAIDYGDKRVGVAIAHNVARLPRPLTTLANTDTLLADLAQLVVQEDVSRVVVGLPRGMDGGYTAQTRVVEAFAERLSRALSVPVELADETLTSIDAESSLASQAHDKNAVDALAAALILERYLADHPTEAKS
ncbi:MAG TPA: Holliday junction resolvase RuvX [Candidatus Saccharimonadales bacterium]|nr:Holliday junction resolvase RuvX [Candidatus Saccharimonadales bacterium]